MAVNTTIRMYNQENLGDCFLLKFHPEGKEEQFILIDFGSYTNNVQREQEIAKDIWQTVGKKRLTIIATHQHRDHISGFSELRKQNENCKNANLWLSFLDDDKGEFGKSLRSATEKYWRKTSEVREFLSKEFSTVKAVDDMLKQKDNFDLFAEQQSGGQFMSSFLALSDAKPKFLQPGEHFFLPETDEGVKVYVLGPPIDFAKLKKMNPSKGEEVIGLKTNTARDPGSKAFESGLELAQLDISGTLVLDALKGLNGQDNSNESNFPFSKRYIANQSQGVEYIKNIYKGDRRIDHNWLSEVGRLALHMDSLTNNTSLVLAFELVNSKKVLLFPGDAQIGNWQSWLHVKFEGTEVDAYDLLSRTVLYKASHHSSGNATLLDSLNLMDTNELTIMIPVDGKVSELRDFDMLKSGMLTGYHRKSQGRVLRSDTKFQDGSDFNLRPPFKDIDTFENLKVNPDTNEGHLSIELIIKDV